MKKLSQHPPRSRSWLEYSLIVIMLTLFAVGVWVYGKANESEETITKKTTVEKVIEPGTPEEIDSITANEVKTDKALFESVDDSETESIIEVDKTANELEGAYDETAY